MHDAIRKTGLAALALVIAALSWPAAGAAPAGDAATRYAQLRELAQQRGEVRVIAEVKIPPGRGSLRARIAAAQSALRAEMSPLNALPDREFARRPLAVYTLGPAQLDRMIESEVVARIYEDRINRPVLNTSLPYVGSDEAHRVGLTGEGAAVAVADTGVDASHSTFGGRVVAEACYSTNLGGQYQTTSLCPGGAESATGPGSAAPCSGIAGCWHGTHVASIAAGANATYTGIAPDAQIIAIQVFSRSDSLLYCNFNPPCILAFDSDIIAGLGFVESLAGTYNLSAVNLSLGGGQFTSSCDGSSAFTSPVADLRAAGISVVVASGNNGYTNAISSPACVSTTYSVGCMNDADGSVCSFSNSSSELDIMAPGYAITAAVPGNSFGTASGTSMSTPHVAGAATLLKAYDDSMSPDMIENMLSTHSVSFTDSRNGLTFPRLDLALVTDQLPILGDIDGDGDRDVADALLLERYLLGEISLAAEEIARGDLYPAGAPDDQLTLADWVALQRLLVAP